MNKRTRMKGTARHAGYWLAALWWLLAFTVFLGACSLPPEGDAGATSAAAELVPASSPNDAYRYRYLTLSNGLKVLLVSAPDSQKAAAALNVNVGSGKNPEGRGGLAHFLEHMLFLGTDKYPDAGAYGRYISEHGGRQNAYTNFEHTNFFFDIEARHLPGALDRFAQFFISPRFDAEYVEREKNAVEAEYRQSLNNDGRRELDVLQELMNPEHPYAQIAVGNLETLADAPGSAVRDELITFYEKWYTPDRMALVVLGAEGLDELESLVRTSFERVGARSVATDSDTDEILAQSQEAVGGDIVPAPLFTDLPLLLQIQPNATRQTLKITFPVPDFRADYDVKPTAYVANLVGHEGAGSLLSQLKAEGLAERLSAGNGLAWPGGALFSVTMSLTEKGVVEYERALELLFAYLDMLRTEGAHEWLYDESARLAELQFRFLQHGEPMGYVSSLATSMHYFAPEDVLRGPYAMERFDGEMIDGLAAYLVPENALVTLTHAEVGTDRVSRWYGVPYSVRASAHAFGVANPSAPGFALPAPNPFIPLDTTLVDPDPEFTDHPVRLLDQATLSAWFGQDDEFRVPKGGIYINFRSPLVAASPGETARSQMYVGLLKDELNELTYPALLAGLNFSFYTSPWGISMRVSGYVDRQQVLLDALLGPMRHPELDQQRFEDIRDRAVRALHNRVSQRPGGQVMAKLNQALLHRQWSDAEMIAAYRAMRLEDVQDFIARFWPTARPEMLVYGNYEPGIVNDVSKALASTVGIGSDGDNGSVESPVATHVVPAGGGARVTRIPAPARLLVPTPVEHDDSVVAWYLQGAGPTWRDRAATALTAQVMQQDFFVKLRTEQQLGYTASAFNFQKFDLPGLVMLIQSPVADALQVSAAMEAFLDDVPGSVGEEQFERHKAALLGDIEQPDKNLWERAEYFWRSMAEGRYGFDSREQLAGAVRQIAFPDWQAYLRQEFMVAPRSLMLVAPGKWELLPDAETVYGSPAELKRSLDHYEFP